MANRNPDYVGAKPGPVNGPGFGGKTPIMPKTKGYTLYFYSQSNSCVLYFGIDGTSKKAVVKLGKEMATSLEKHYFSMGKNYRIRVTAEEYKPKTQ